VCFFKKWDIYLAVDCQLHFSVEELKWFVAPARVQVWGAGQVRANKIPLSTQHGVLQSLKQV